MLTWIATRLRDAEIALHNGDAGPRISVWTRNEPATLFGAWISGSGQEELRGIFRRLTDRPTSIEPVSSPSLVEQVERGALDRTVGQMRHEVGQPVPDRPGTRISDAERYVRLSDLNRTGAKRSPIW